MLRKIKLFLLSLCWCRSMLGYNNAEGLIINLQNLNTWKPGCAQEQCCVGLWSKWGTLFNLVLSASLCQSFKFLRYHILQQPLEGTRLQVLCLVRFVRDKKQLLFPSMFLDCSASTEGEKKCWCQCHQWSTLCMLKNWFMAIFFKKFLLFRMILLKSNQVDRMSHKGFKDE